MKQPAITPNFHVIKVKALPATDTKCRRIKITSARFGESITISYDYDYNSQAEGAAAHLRTLGYNVIGKAEHTGRSAGAKDTDYLIVGNFASLKEMKIQYINSNR